MVKGVERPAHPQVLLDVNEGRTQPPGRREEKIGSIGRLCADDVQECVCRHVLFAVPADMIGPRKMSCIQIGMAESPMRRSSASFGPLSRSLSSFRMI